MRRVAAELVVAVRGGVTHDRVREGLVDLLVGHREMFAVLGRELDVDRLVVAVQEDAPPVGVPLDPLVGGDVQGHGLHATAEPAAVTLARCSATSPTPQLPAASTAASCPTPRPAPTTRSWPSARTRSTAAS